MSLDNSDDDSCTYLYEEDSEKVCYRYDDDAEADDSAEDDDDALRYLDEFLQQKEDSGIIEEDGCCLFNFDPTTCPICYAKADSGEAIILPKCLHSFCMDCFKKCIESQIHNGKANELSCPMPIEECGAAIDRAILKDVLDEETFRKLQYCQESAFVLSHPEYHHCPTPDCSNIVYWKEGSGPPIVDCFKCNKTSCLKCGASPYHTNRSCEDYKQIHEALHMRQMIEARRARFYSKINRGRNDPTAPLPLPTPTPVDVDRSRAGEELTYEFQLPTSGAAVTLGGTGINNENNICICRRCGNGIEHSSGCYKMKCRCGYRFCVKCGSENAQCDCTPSHHGFVDNVTGRGDFAGLKENQSYT